MNLIGKIRRKSRRLQSTKYLKFANLLALVMLLCLLSPASMDKHTNTSQVLAQAQSSTIIIGSKSIIESKQFDYQQGTNLFAFRDQITPSIISENVEKVDNCNFIVKDTQVFENKIAWHQFDIIRINQLYDDRYSEIIIKEEEVVIEETPETPVISSEGPGNTYYYSVTDEEKLEMAMMVYAEANIEPFRGKVAVAAVILNRWVRDQTSIHDVLTAPGQFADSSYVTKELLEQYPDNYEAVEQALRGWDPTRELFPDGAHYFYAPEYVSEEAQKARDGVPTLIIGGHNFHDEFAK